MGTTTTPSERLREAIAALQLTPIEAWESVRIEARALAAAIAAEDFDEIERSAGYIADVTAYLARGK